MMVLHRLSNTPPDFRPQRLSMREKLQLMDLYHPLCSGIIGGSAGVQMALHSFYDVPLTTLVQLYKKILLRGLMIRQH